MNVMLLTGCILLLAALHCEAQYAGKWGKVGEKLKSKVKQWNNNNPCQPDPCNKNGWCQRVGRREYKCRCRPGYFGEHCERQNACASQPCMNRGRCTPEDEGSYTCRCRQGFVGDHCQIRNPCYPNPCQNRGECVRDEEAEIGFHCVCSNDYSSGDLCEITDWNAKVAEYQEGLDEKITRMCNEWERDGTVKMYSILKRDQVGCIKRTCLEDDYTISEEPMCSKTDLYSADSLMKERFVQYMKCIADVRQKSVCTLPMNPGPCRRFTTRYYYDAASGECLKFQWGGCASKKLGKGNVFRTKEECQATCGNGTEPFDPEQALTQCFDTFMNSPPDFTELANQNCADCIMHHCAPTTEEWEEDDEEVDEESDAEEGLD